MLTVNQIKESVNDILVKYPIKKVSLFGSYANGTADANSDVDLLVEFFSSNVSLIMLFDIKDEIEAKLSKKVDIIHAPLDEDSMIKFDKVVDIYEH